MKSPRICIIGHGECGKDLAAEMLCNLTWWTASSSSWTAAKLISSRLAEKYGLYYLSTEEAFNDRRNHRDEWKECIQFLCKDDKTFLAKKIYETSNIYVGQRDREEFEACLEVGLHDLVIWIQRDGTPVDSTLGMTADDADIVIMNNGTKPDMLRKLTNLTLTIFSRQ